MKRFIVALAMLLGVNCAAHADIYNWSQTPASNTNSDLADDVNWVEGMPPGEVNNSARAMMSEIRKWVDDLGASKPSNLLMTTAGSANAQTLSTNGSGNGLTHGQTVCFIVGGGLTNTSSVTLNVDSAGAKAVQGIDGTALAGGELAAGSLQCVTYQATDQVWLLHQYRPIDLTTITYTAAGALQVADGSITSAKITNGTIDTADLKDGSVTADKLAAGLTNGNMYVGMVFDYTGTSCPALSVGAYGQAINRTTYSALFGVMSTTFGIGDGSSTFNMPDLRGRVVAGEDDMGGVSANRITTTFNGDTFGGTGGEELHTMTTGEMVAHTHTQQGSFASGTESAGHTHTVSGTTSTESADHTHSGSGTTSGQSVSHSHTYTVPAGTDNIADTGSGTNIVSGTGSSSTGVASSDHSHTYSFATGGRSAAHTHTWSGTSAGASVTHTHSTTISGATTSVGSTTPFNVLQPTMVLQKCIYAGV